MAEYAIESVVETVRPATASLAQNKKLALKTEVPKPLPVGLGERAAPHRGAPQSRWQCHQVYDAGEVRVTAKAVNGHFVVASRIRAQVS
jgi:hypothetical protein